MFTCNCKTSGPTFTRVSSKTEKDMEEVARSLNLGVKEIKNRVAELHELNPMLGHRGCRLGISFPEIYEMQCKAI